MVSPDERDADPESTGPRPVPLSTEQVAGAVRTALEGFGSVVPSRHFRGRGGQRDFTTQDALEVLRSGAVGLRAVWNERLGTWNYDITGVDPEGDALTVRIAVSPSGTMITLVTAF